jgi:hypothetical protein
LGFGRKTKGAKQSDHLPMVTQVSRPCPTGAAGACAAPHLRGHAGGARSARHRAVEPRSLRGGERMDGRARAAMCCWATAAARKDEV